MKTRKLTLILAGTVLLAGTTLALAGPGGRAGGGTHGHGMGPMHGPLGPLGRALHRLDLSEEQQDKVQAILDQAEPTFEALHEQMRANREAFREANPPTSFDEAAIRAHVAQQSAIHADMAVARGKVRSQVLAVLTPEQLAELETMREEMKDCVGGRMGHGGSGGGPGW